MSGLNAHPHTLDPEPQTRNAPPVHRCIGESGCEPGVGAPGDCTRLVQIPQYLALTVFYVPYSLDSGAGASPVLALARALRVGQCKNSRSVASPCFIAAFDIGAVVRGVRFCLGVEQNMAHIRQSMSDFGMGFQEKHQPFEWFPLRRRRCFWVGQHNLFDILVSRGVRLRGFRRCVGMSGYQALAGAPGCQVMRLSQVCRDVRL